MIKNVNLKLVERTSRKTGNKYQVLVAEINGINVDMGYPSRELECYCKLTNSVL